MSIIRKLEAQSSVLQQDNIGAFAWKRMVRDLVQRKLDKST